MEESYKAAVKPFIIGDLMLERLQKIIARAGLASRRHAEEMIVSGLVTVNGATVTELGSKADVSRDHIKVSGKLLQPETARAYLILHKPAEVVSTMSDPEGRRSLQDLLSGVSERVFPVGRLEYHASGLVFLTNDGDLANRIIQSHKLSQTYHLKLKSLLTFEEIEKLARLTGAHISRLRGADAPWYEVTISEARRDALRNKLFQTGNPVEKMKRVRIGSVALESLPAGAHRELSPVEVSALSRALQGDLPVQVIRNPGGKISKPRPRRPLTMTPRHDSQNSPAPSEGGFPRESHGSEVPLKGSLRYDDQDSEVPSKGGFRPGSQDSHASAKGSFRPGSQGTQRPSKGGFRRESQDSRASAKGNFRRDNQGTHAPSRGSFGRNRSDSRPSSNRPSSRPSTGPRGSRAPHKPKSPRR
jgi:23S rRNA pseudouridine2605 synthase